MAMSECWKQVHSITGRSLKKEFREQTRHALPRHSDPLNRLASVSLFDMTTTSATCTATAAATSPRSSSPGSATVTTCSPTNTNNGYASDESGSQSSGAPQPRIKMAAGHRRPATTTRSLTKRASFWQKRVEQGLLSDSSVNEEYPPPESCPYE